MSTLDLPCLKLTKGWVPLDIINARQAFLDAAAGAVTLLKFHEGYPTPYRLDDWLNLPVEDKEDYVGTGGRMHEIKRVAIPRVCIAVNFNRIIAKEQPCTPENLLKRYGHKDAVTGKKLKRDKFSREHVTPKSKGGGGGWDNLVPMDRNENSRRGNRPYEQVGLKKPKILPAPHPLLPINSMVNQHGWPEWDMFGIRRPQETA
jgi:hypothetical protein